MSTKLQSLRGMKDLFGEDFEIHDHVVKTAQIVSSLYCYEGLSVPILEYTKVFDRTLGDSSDVVSKEMYNFLDKSGDNVALRPEFTAGVMRAFIANGLQHKLPLKLFSHGPLFRYDRPQAGRQRQFHQVNFEHLGSNEPYSDAELIKLATSFFAELNISEYIKIELNSLGCLESRASYQKALVDYFTKYHQDLSYDSKQRLVKNPLRILDSKDEGDIRVASDAPLIADYYTNEASKYFDKVLNYLEIFNISYQINHKLVRGLDYYCHTAFEFTTDKLGSQSAVGGGGRYDYLCELMGGGSVPAVGFACGIERIALILACNNYKSEKLAPVYIMSIGQECEEHIIQLAESLRSNFVAVTVELKGKLQKRMEKALKNGAEYIIFAGVDELQNNNFKLKILSTREEKALTTSEILEFFKGS